MLSNKLFNFSKISIFVLIIVNSACGQQKLTEITDKNEVKVDFEFIGKPGEVKPYMIDLKSIPNGSKLPSGYQLLANKSYDIKNDVIEYGETILTFKLPLNNKVEFQNARILRLTSNELNPNGFEWQDCTITGQDWIYEQEKEPSESRKERIFKFLPDFSKKQISCAPQDRLQPDNYFVSTLQTQTPPNQPVTNILTKLERAEHSSERDETIYVVSFKNAGRRAVSELNFYSHFDDDTKLVTIKPNQGRCQRSRFGTGAGSVVCYLGPLAPDASAVVEFIAQPSNFGGSTKTGQLNIDWLIEGFVKENPDDSNWSINSFRFRSLAK
jgi:hypothetical protein